MHGGKKLELRRKKSRKHMCFVVDIGLLVFSKVGPLPTLANTTPDLHITAGLITARFMRTGSDVPSLSVMSLKIKK